MQSPDSQQIVRRFFEAFEILKEMRVIRGISLSSSSYTRVPKIEEPIRTMVEPQSTAIG